MLTLEQIRTQLTEEEALADILEVLNAAEFELGAWQSGVIRASILRALAKFCVVCQAFADSLSRINFNADSTGTALKHYSRENWGNNYIEAKATEGWEKFTGGAVGPPHTIEVGKAVVSDGVRTFRNLEQFTVPQSGYIYAKIYAEVPGSAGNVPNGTITTMVTTYAGVTCSNAAYGSTGTWITKNGANEETEDALRARNSSSVGILSALETLDDRYEYVARKAVVNARVKVDSSNPRGPGTVDVYVAGAAGVAGSEDIDDIDAKIQAAKFGSVLTKAASAVSIDPVGTVYYSGSFATASASVTSKLLDYINGLQIGGLDLSPGPANMVPEDGITTAIRSATGVLGFDYTRGARSIGKFEVAVLGTLAGVTWVQVAG
jgi:uncharacterized phage protein gp47/JayE